MDGKVNSGKSFHLAAILVTPLCSYFGPTGPVPFINESGMSQNLTFNGHLAIKGITSQIAIILKSQVTLRQNKA